MMALLHAAAGAVIILAAINAASADATSTSYACVVLASEGATGSVFGMHDLPDGTVLIDAEKGWFHFDPAAGWVVPAGEAVTGRVFQMHNLPGGAVLIGAEKGLFRFDPTAGRVVPAGEAATGQVSRYTTSPAALC